MSKKAKFDTAVNCCCQCRKNSDTAPDQVTAKLLYRIAFTIWHVAFHIENEQVCYHKNLIFLFLGQARLKVSAKVVKSVT